MKIGFDFSKTIATFPHVDFMGDFDRETLNEYKTGKASSVLKYEQNLHYGFVNKLLYYELLPGTKEGLKKLAEDNELSIFSTCMTNYVQWILNMEGIHEIKPQNIFASIELNHPNDDLRIKSVSGIRNFNWLIGGLEVYVDDKLDELKRFREVLPSVQLFHINGRGSYKNNIIPVKTLEEVANYVK